MAKYNQSLEQLFLTALQNRGNGILNDPKRFAAVMSDLISGNMDDQDLYRSIFKSRFPTFFASLNNDQSALEDAVLSATDYIINNYHLNEEWARTLAEDLGYAIQSYNKMPRRVFAVKPVETSQTGGGVNVPPHHPNKNVLPYVLLCVGLAVVIAVIIFFLANSGSLSRKENVDPTEEPAYTQTATPTVEPTETVTPSPTPTPTPDPTDDIKSAVGKYLVAFVSDVNNGYYSDMYGAVLSNSSMEKTQKEFLDKRRGDNIREEILQYDITSVSRIDDNTYYATAIETYEIWMDAEPPHSKVKQKCVYKVVRQDNGNWIVSDFVGEEETLERTVY